MVELDADVLEHLPRRQRVALRLHHVVRAAGSEQYLAIVLELVALGVAAEVVVVLENQDTGVRASLLAEEIGRRQTTEAGTDDDQIVGLAGVLRLIKRHPVTGGVRRLERARMRAPHAGAGRRVVARRLLGRVGRCHATGV